VHSTSILGTLRWRRADHVARQPLCVGRRAGRCRIEGSVRALRGCDNTVCVRVSQHWSAARGRRLAAPRCSLTGSARCVAESSIGPRRSWSGRARAYIGHVASLFRAACVNHPFEASSASHTLLAPDIQRYFRDINVLHQHPAIQPNSCDEIYDRVLAGVDPNSEIV
jgi:hypothetical protein